MKNIFCKNFKNLNLVMIIMKKLKTLMIKKKQYI